jgi:hypothetical protein
MKTAQIVRELEEAARRLGLRVRYESGTFRGGRCTVSGEGMVVLNRRRPVETHLAVLADALRELPVDSLYLRPAVREALEAAWARRAAGWEGGPEEPAE